MSKKPQFSVRVRRGFAHILAFIREDVDTDPHHKSHPLMRRHLSESREDISRALEYMEYMKKGTDARDQRGYVSKLKKEREAPPSARTEEGPTSGEAGQQPSAGLNPEAPSEGP